MNVIVYASLVSAMATVVIAFCAIVSFFIAFSIWKRDKEFRQQTSDLFQAIAISNILSDPNANLGSTHLENKIKAFKDSYKGETPIFVKEGANAKT